MRRRLKELAKEVADALGGQMIGFYVFGSFVSNEWNPARSDVDFLVVTRKALGAPARRALVDLHRRWAAAEVGPRLEGEHIDIASLRRHDFSVDVLAVEGTGIAWQSSRLSADNLKSLLEEGTAIIGLPIAQLGVRVTPRQYAAAVRAMLREDELELHAAEPEDLPRVLVDVLRCIYALETGRLPGKGRAVEHSRARLGHALARSLHGWLEGRSPVPSVDRETVGAILRLARARRIAEEKSPPGGKP